MALLLEGPGENEILQRSPLVDRTGQFVFHSLLRPLGLTRDDVIIANTIRCRKEENEYPEGTIRARAERCCRQYDWYHGDDKGQLVSAGLADWDPSLFVVTLHPAAIFRENAYFFLVRKDFEKAFRYTSLGYRVCILCGDKAASMIYPVIEGSGGVTFWRGHVFEGSLRTTQKPSQKQGEFVQIKEIKSLRPATWRRRRKPPVAEQIGLII